MNWTMKWTCKLWKSMNWKNESMKKYELKLWIGLWIDVSNDYEMTMKWLWIHLWNLIWNELWNNLWNNDMNWLWIVCFKYEKVWIYVWKSIFQQAYYMKVYEKVFFNKLFIWKCMNDLNIVSYEVCIYLGLNEAGRARRDTYEAL